MRYQEIVRGAFLERPNRFIARVDLDGQTVVAHVKNTGRCRELLLPGAAVYLERAASTARKTAFDLVAVEKARSGRPPLLINMDAQAPNRVFHEWVLTGKGAEAGLPRPTLLRPETTWGNSRFDFYWEESDSRRRGYVEVKGVTLEEDGIVRFPDAPTERGVKHLEELIACQAEGYEAAVCFVIQMSGMRDFSPNDATHPAFGDALRRAAASGVRVLAMECLVEPGGLWIHRSVPVNLNMQDII